MSCITLFTRGLALLLLALFLISPDIDTLVCLLPLIILLWIASNHKPKSKKEQGLSGSGEGVSGSAQAPGSVDDLVEIIRFSQDPEARRKALQKLKELGLVEEL